MAKSREEKDIWISNLLLLSQKPILERTLDSILSEEERRIPLKLPDPTQYRFAEKDSPFNIVFDSSSGKDLIKAATLTKLIERLTYHQFADPKFLKIFLTTYRSFCTPEILLDLLIERFNIPFEDELQTPNESTSLTREELKRFKKEYLEPIQLRVLNVMKHWIESHYYDLDEKMKKKLNDFLEQLQKKKQRKNLKKWVDNLIDKIKKKEESNEEKKQKFLGDKLPQILNLYEKESNQFNLLTIHPVEFSRQLTLYEFDLYCSVNPFELMGAKWTKPDKQLHSPNLIKLIQHSSKFVYWLEKEIVECPNLEERQAIICRLIEMLQVLYELNNFNGLFEIISALESSSIHRLELTFNGLPTKSVKIKNEMCELRGGGHFQRYKELLAQINPPCVPFFGKYLTELVHLEQGNPDYIENNKQLINFSKRRRIAEITSEIQQYQNQPYCLQVYPELREFIVNLDPLGEMSEKEFDDYTFKKSLEIEPRNCKPGNKQPPKGERKYKDINLKYKDINLKSPGIKPSNIFTSSSSISSISSSLSFANNFLSNHHHHQASTSSITNSSSNACSSNPQTPNQLSSPTSTTFFPSTNTINNNKSSPPSVIDTDNTIFAPILISSSSNSIYLQQQQQLIDNLNNSTTQFRTNNANLMAGNSTLSNIISSNSTNNWNSSLINSSTNKVPPLPTQMNAPPLPPRTNRSSFSCGVHQRTNSESSTASTISPNVLSSHSVLNTPLSSGGNQAANVFTFNNNAINCLPLPPKGSNLRTPTLISNSQLSPNLINSNNNNNQLQNENNSTAVAAPNIPPPIPPRRKV